HGYHVTIAHDLESATKRLLDRQPDIVVLDRLVGGEDAIARIEGWRAESRAPILVLTSLTGVHERIRGLDSGADDYLAKPADPGEIDARIRALLRRGAGQQSGDMLRNGPLGIDRLRREARVRDRLLPLHPREYRLLEELALRQGDVVARSTLLKSVWDLNFEPRTKLLEVHVSRLRTKLRDAGAASLIDTVRGTGYRLNDWPRDA
ncbi:MAG: response regulator transcription factor, partial [Sphingomonadales bacterium]